MTDSPFEVRSQTVEVAAFGYPDLVMSPAGARGVLIPARVTFMYTWSASSTGVFVRIDGRLRLEDHTPGADAHDSAAWEWEYGVDPVPEWLPTWLTGLVVDKAPQGWTDTRRRAEIAVNAMTGNRQPVAPALLTVTVQMPQEVTLEPGLRIITTTDLDTKEVTSFVPLNASHGLTAALRLTDDERADLGVKLLQYPACRSNVPTGNHDDQARWCVMPAAHGGKYHQDDKGHLWTDKDAEHRNPPKELRDDIIADADAYRWLRDEISDTMEDPNRWDGDDSEEYILAEYVRWLAKGRSGHRAETAEEIAEVIDEHCEQHGVPGVGDKIRSLAVSDRQQLRALTLNEAADVAHSLGRQWTGSGHTAAVQITSELKTLAAVAMTPAPTAKEN